VEGDRVSFKTEGVMPCCCSNCVSVNEPVLGDKMQTTFNIAAEWGTSKLALQGDLQICMHNQKRNAQTTRDPKLTANELRSSK